MTKSKREYKRVRPLLGTFFEISALSFEENDKVGAEITKAYREAERLEKIFNFHDSNSELSRMNRGEVAEPSAELQFVLQLAEEMSRLSKGGFSAVRPADRKVDLSGIAKGFIVDRITELLSFAMPDAEGCVNAGGDMRFFGNDAREAAIRLRPELFRRMMVSHAAVAVSSPSSPSGESSTVYHGSRADHFEDGGTVAVFAASCAVADAFTKVAMHAPMAVVANAARHFGCDTVFFDRDGAVRVSVVGA